MVGRVLSVSVGGLSVAWTFPRLNSCGSGQGPRAGPEGTGVRDGAGSSQDCVFKSKVFTLISSRSVRQKQFLKQALSFVNL